MSWIFSCPWPPSAFHFFKGKFLGTNWLDLSDFCKNTTMGSLITILQFSAVVFLYILNKNLYLFFEKSFCIFWSPVFKISLEMLMFLLSWPGPKFPEAQIVSPASFWRNYLKAQVFSECNCCLVGFLWPKIPNILVLVRRWVMKRKL